MKILEWITPIVILLAMSSAQAFDLEFAAGGILSYGMLSSDVSVNNQWDSFNGHPSHLQIDEDSSDFRYGILLEGRYQNLAAETGMYLSDYAFTIDNRTRNWKAEWELSYLDFPLIARYYFLKLGSIEFNAGAGFVMSILMNETQSVEGTPNGTGVPNMSGRWTWAYHIDGGANLDLTQEFFVGGRLSYEGSMRDRSATKGLDAKGSRIDLGVLGGYRF